MYMADGWGSSTRSTSLGTAGRIVWKMDPGAGRQDRNRGVALWGNSSSRSPARRPRHRHRQGDRQVVWDKNLRDQQERAQRGAARARDSIIVGASGGDLGMRDWIVALDPRTGNVQWKTYSCRRRASPAARPGRTRTSLADRRRRVLGHRLLRSGYQPDLLGIGNPVPSSTPIGPGDNLFTSSAIAFDAATGKIKWWFQYTPNLTFGYDETGSHIIIDAKVNGEDRKILSHAAATASTTRWTHQRPVPQGRAVRHQGDLDQGHRSQDRQAGRLRSRPRISRLCERAPAS